MKATNSFKKIIENHLNAVALNDSLFAKTLSNKKKNIDDCVTYIMNQVKQSGRNGFADQEIFNMAIHYYDEDNIKIGNPVKVKVIINQTDDSPEAKVISKPVERKAKLVKLNPSNQVSIFDIPGV